MTTEPTAAAEPTAAPLAFEFEIDAPLADAIEQVTAALKTEGFGVLTRIDVHDVLKAKLDHDFRPYTILGTCNPPLAKKALEARAEIGLLLPCNVVVEEATPGRSTVRVGRPTTLMNVGDVASDPNLGPLAAEVSDKLAVVVRGLGGSA